MKPWSISRNTRVAQDPTVSTTRSRSWGPYRFSFLQHSKCKIGQQYSVPHSVKKSLSLVMVDYCLHSSCQTLLRQCEPVVVHQCQCKPFLAMDFSQVNLILEHQMLTIDPGQVSHNIVLTSFFLKEEDRGGCQTRAGQRQK